MDDLISRQAAIDAVDKGCQEWRGIFERCEKNILSLPSVHPEPQGITCGAALATEYIKQLPSAQPKQRWIPYDPSQEVGSIPSYGKRVLITYKDDDGTQEVLQAIWIQPFITNDGYMLDSEVTAFMPFPEPYKEGEK